MDCLRQRTGEYMKLCEQNIHSYETTKNILCAFAKEVVHQCGNTSHVWTRWREVTKCGVWRSLSEWLHHYRMRMFNSDS